MNVIDKEKWIQFKEYLFNKLGYVPHSEGQWGVHRSTARIKVVCAGTRWGKSLCAAKDVLPYMYMPGSRGWIVAPSYALGEKEFRYLTDDISKLELPVARRHYDVRGGNMDFKLGNGAECVVKSTDVPSSLLGEELDWVIISEGSQITREVWERYIVARLSNRKGMCIIPTTPAGYDDFLYPLFIKGLDKSQDMIQSWQYTTGDNPLFDRQELKNAEALLSPEFYEEQYGGRFVAFTGRVYKMFDLNMHVIDQFPVPKEWERYRVIDYGSTNPFVCLWFAMGPDNTAYVYQEHYEAGQPIPYHAKIISEKSKGQSIESSYIDPSAGIKLDLMYEGIDCLDAENELIPGLERVRQALIPDKNSGKPHLYVMRNCVNTVREMLEYAYPKKKGDVNTKEVPLKINDHSCDCVRYFFMTRPEFEGKYVPRPLKKGFSVNDFIEITEGLKRVDGRMGNEYADEGSYGFYHN